jgi:CRISPR-associated protein Cas5h
MKVVSFRIWGKFAHFRKFWTTTSSLSYPFPPPTAVRGILGAILGFSKWEYIEKTQPFKVGVEILKPPKVIKLGLNFLNTKELTVKYKNFIRKYQQNIEKQKHPKEVLLHTQTLVEVLKEPEYRIFVTSEDATLLGTLEETLKRGENHYTVSLGWANFLANFEYEGSYSCEPVETTDGVRTVIPVSCVQSLEFEENHLVGREIIPTRLSAERKPLSYESVIFSLSAKPLKGVFKNVYLCGERGGIYLF